MDASICNKYHKAHITQVDGRAHLQQLSLSPHYSNLWMRSTATNIMEPTLLEFYGCAQLQQTSWIPHYSKLWTCSTATNIMEPSFLEFYGRVNLKQTSWSPPNSSYECAQLQQTSWSPHYSNLWMRLTAKNIMEPTLLEFMDMLNSNTHQGTLIS